MLSIDVVIPVYNGWELTKLCLEHLSAQSLPHSVTVVDNGSEDGTAERVREQFSHVGVLELPANAGFATACNAGARSGTGDVVVLLNNDVECRPDFLERLIAPLDDSRVGSVAALLLVPNEERIESFGLVVDPTLAGYPRLRGAPREAVVRADGVLAGPSGAAAAFRRKAWDSVDGLDHNVFAYGEDVDLALRLRGAGWRAALAPDAVAVHTGSATAGVRSRWQRYQGGFSRGYFLRRYGVLKSRRAIRAAATEAIVIAGDALVFSRDLAALRGRVAGWRAASGLPRHPSPPDTAVDCSITFVDSLRKRLKVYSP